MNGNTAVFYDVENLTDGYSENWMQKVNISTILSQIKGHYKVGNIVVQKAYANWKSSVLNVLKTAFANRDIELIDVFKTSPYQTTKDLIDMKIVVDIMELIGSATSIETIVIVSGDSGFSLITEQLQSKGIYVLGAGFKKQKSVSLQNITDDYITLLESKTPTMLYKNSKEKWTSRIDSIPSLNTQDAVAFVKQIITLIENDRELFYITGMQHLSASFMKELITDYIVNFNVKNYGCEKFSAFLQGALDNTNFYVCIIEDQAYILNRCQISSDMIKLPHRHLLETGTPTHYMALIKMKKDFSIKKLKFYIQKCKEHSDQINEAMYYLDFLKRADIIYSDPAGKVYVNDEDTLQNQIIEFIKRTLEEEKMTVNNKSLYILKELLESQD